MDVFEPIKDAFDLIISFNLLQENYFSRERIEAGMANLRDALEENGLLIMGDTEAYSVSRKVNGELLVVKREGQF
jgi:chemotaxis methyl-accepting protein methylase